RSLDRLVSRQNGLRRNAVRGGTALGGNCLPEPYWKYCKPRGTCPMRKGTATRERILEIAEAAVLAKGFGATSIEELIAAAGITKSGFFYHFKDKNELASGLLDRHGRALHQLLVDVFGRAGELSDDPLQYLLVGLTLLAEHMAEMPGGHPGCVVAAL